MFSVRINYHCSCYSASDNNTVYTLYFTTPDPWFQVNLWFLLTKFKSVFLVVFCQRLQCTGIQLHWATGHINNLKKKCMCIFQLKAFTHACITVSFISFGVYGHVTSWFDSNTWKIFYLIMTLAFLSLFQSVILHVPINYHWKFNPR